MILKTPSFLFVAAATISAFAGIHALAADEHPSADPTSLYRSAVGVMDALPPLPDGTFETVVHLSGANMQIHKAANGRAEVVLANGTLQNEHWLGAYEHVSGRVTIKLKDGSSAYVDVPLFNPTWEAARNWMRNTVHAAAAAPRGHIVDVPTHPAANLKTIASVTVVAPTNYKTRYAGAATCPNGDAGEALSLQPTTDPLNHPLRSAIVDRTNGRFCSVQFQLYNKYPFGAAGQAQLNFKDAAGHWVVSDGVVRLDEREAGARTPAKRISVEFERTNLTFK
jgi:hypothetical protein